MILEDINLEKRRRIMQRSKMLGHCICDPKRTCPCDVLTTQNICPCAGERPTPTSLPEIKLTQLVHNAGCASKIPAADLEHLLARLPVVDDPAVISGLSAGDDAALYKIDDNITLVQTVDVFTPCVDDPYSFGKICAANCLSDIYAMGGTPRTALSVLAFPSETQDKEIMFLMLKGAMEVLAKAQCSLIGGHSIKDEEIKLGFAITGTIENSQISTFETAKVGDRLVLTKPLGVGVLTFANQIGRANPSGLAEAERSMMELNKDASEAMRKVGVNAATDITGFGLFGHLARMLRHSQAAARIYAKSLPTFEGVLELLRDGVINGAMERNAEFVADDLIVDDEVSEEYKYLGFSAETSGGLLISVAANRHQVLVDELESRGVMAVTIGEVIEGKKGGIEMVSSKGAPNMPLNKMPDLSRNVANPEPCCGSHGDANLGMSTGETESTVAGSLKAFGDMVAAITASGKVDKKVKELIIFSLVVAQRCAGCLQMHFDKALSMGITKDELDEAAWCAVLIGGAPVKMFYSEFLNHRKTSEAIK